MTAPRRIYFNEYGLLQGGKGTTAYLPLVTGTMHAWALQHADIVEHYEFAPYLFHRDLPDNLLSAYESPSVAAFSMYIWNAELCLHVAAEVKRRWPDCLIVFGGAHVPHQSKEFLEQHPFIDVAIRAEGEDAFIEVLQRYISSRTFEDITGVTWRTPDGTKVKCEPDRAFDRDLSKYPSPYLLGLYDDLMRDHPELEFQAIIETNRGCPFLCTFCYWGKGGLNLKFKYHALDRIEQEIDWMARNKIRYILSADSNFGMHERDREIARYLIEAQEKHGYPERFRATYGKNTDERIFDVASALAKAGLDKGVSITHQSLSKDVQNNIKRWNIKLDSYERLQKRFNEAGIATHSDLIIGLPGETFSSLADGIQKLLERGAVHLNIYFLEVYPNTDMANAEYQKEFGLRSVRTLQQENHCDVRKPEEVTEYVDIIVENKWMSTEEWKRMWCLAFITMLFQSLKMGYFLMYYLSERFGIPFTDFFSFISEADMKKGTAPLMRSELERYRGSLDDILNGAGIGAVEPDFGTIYWRIEEAGFIRLSDHLDTFYDEMVDVLAQLCESRGVEFDIEELREVVRYQRLRMPSTKPLSQTEYAFAWNVPEYCEGLLTGSLVALEKKPQVLRVDSIDYKGDRVTFANERVLYARKNESTMNRVWWRPAGVMQQA